MARGQVVGICQFGGSFSLANDGTWSYTGGEAHAVDISREMLLDDLKAEIAGMFDIDISNLSMKYMLPSNKRTLITISRDKDLTHMIDFNMGYMTIDIYISNLAKDRGTITPIADSGTSIMENVAAKVDNRISASLFDTPIKSIMDASNNADPNCKEPCSLRYLWDGLITDVGQEFDNVKAFRVDLSKYACARGFRYKYIKNDHNRVTVQCDAENCLWRLHASTPSHSQKFMIKRFNKVHTCGDRIGEYGHLTLTKFWLAGFLKEKLLDNPQYKPKEIIRDVLQVHGVNLNYTQAWHARESALKELRLLHEEMFCQLPLLRDKIMETNPGSIVRLDTSSDSKIRRFFFAFQASLHGFRNGCRPLIFLDKIYLKANDTWRLLGAAAVDGDDETFPVAFAVVEAETPDSWLWFLVQLRDAISVPENLTIFSNRRMELDESVPRVFEGCHHSYSLTHLVEEFKVDFKNSSCTEEVKQVMVGHIKDAAQAYVVEEFNACIEKIKAISADAAEWVLSAKPERWSNAHFGVARYDHFSSNIVECLSMRILTKDESSVVHMVEAIRVRFMEVIDSRRRTCSNWTAAVTPSSEGKLLKVMSKARPQTVVCLSDTVFEVHGCVVDVVDIGRWECTCRRWQHNGLPCVHAAAVIAQIGGSVYDFCVRYFKRESYLLTYSGSINPIAEIETLASVLGPSCSLITKSPGGRRKRIRIENNNNTSVRPLHCSICKVAGHNKATCEAQLQIKEVSNL